MQTHPPVSDLPLIDGHAVREARRRRGLTISQLAGRAEMNQGNLWSIEAGKRSALARTPLVDALTAALDVDSAQIVIPATPYAR